MIYGIGTDIVSVGRMAHLLARYGDRFAARILSPDELDAYARAAKPAHFLAKRFAAKEACAKALGLGFRDGLSLRHIGVGSDPRGKPLLEFRERAESLLSELGIGEHFISLADEQDYAIAYVTLLKRSS